MRDKNLDTGDSWPIAFFTTGICFFIFISFLKIIDNSFPRYFLWIGISSLLSGFFSLVKKNSTDGM